MRRCDIMDYMGITKKYYSKFCCINNLDDYDGKIIFICSNKRDETVKGYGCKFILYCYVTSNLAIITYNPNLESKINKIKDIITLENIKKVLIKSFPKISKKTLMVFNEEKGNVYGDAKILKENDYNAFEKFFKKENPDSNTEGWLKDYFLDKVQLHYFVGYYKKEELVSVCDAPDMPHMENVIQHIGISTLISERRKGYAKKYVLLQ